MLVPPELLRRDREELREVAVQQPLHGWKVQRLKLVRLVLAACLLRKPEPIMMARDADNRLVTVCRDEVVEADAEHHRDPQQRRQRWKELSTFDLREQPWRQSRVLSQFDEAQLLFESNR